MEVGFELMSVGFQCSHSFCYSTVQRWKFSISTVLVVIIIINKYYLYLMTIIFQMYVALIFGTLRVLCNYSALAQFRSGDIWILY